MLLPDINVEVVPPRRLRIHLARADLLQVSDTFGYLFAIFLTAAGTFGGAILTGGEASKLELAALLLIGTSAIAFLILAIRYRRGARRGGVDSG